MTDLHVAPPTYEEWRERLLRGDRPRPTELWDDLHDRPAGWILTYATRLFRESGSLREQYTSRELERGLWALPLAWELSDRLWDREVAWALRAGCVEAMPQLFEQLFQKDPLGTSCFMWWDMFRPVDPHIMTLASGPSCFEHWARCWRSRTRSAKERHSTDLATCAIMGRSA